MRKDDTAWLHEPEARRSGVEMVSGPRAARNLAGPTQLPFENLRAPGCTCEIHEMD
jgi:hypothetical protein